MFSSSFVRRIFKWCHTISADNVFECAYLFPKEIEIERLWREKSNFLLRFHVPDFLECDQSIFIVDCWIVVQRARQGKVSVRLFAITVLRRLGNRPFRLRARYNRVKVCNNMFGAVCK